MLAGDAEAYTYLPKSTADLPAEPELRDRLRLAGFADVGYRTFTGGSVLLLTGTRVEGPSGRADHMTTTPAPARLARSPREVAPGDDSRLADRRVLGAGFRVVAPRRAHRRHRRRRAVTADDVATALAAIDVDDPLGLPGTRVDSRSACCRSTPPASTTGPASSSSRHVCTARRQAAPGSPRSGRGRRRTGAHDSPARVHRRGHAFGEEWEAIVARAIVPIERGELEKVVLAREVVVEADQAFDVRDILARLVHQQPGCFVYASDGLVGASPELLVRRTGNVVESRPVAGTAVAEGEESLRRLAASVKDTHEHRFVVDAILVVPRAGVHQSLHAAPGDPEVAVFGPIAHLATPVRGELAVARGARPAGRAGPRPPAPSHARGRRHAPAGRARRDPRARGLRSRGRYAGPVGWVDAGLAATAVGHRARGAELDGTRARLVAGAGIVAGSDPAAEWAETQAKLDPMLRALVRP